MTLLNQRKNRFYQLSCIFNIPSTSHPNWKHMLGGMRVRALVRTCVCTDSKSTRKSKFYYKYISLTFLTEEHYFRKRHKMNPKKNSFKHKSINLVTSMVWLPSLSYTLVSNITSFGFLLFVFSFKCHKRLQKKIETFETFCNTTELSGKLQ